MNVRAIKTADSDAAVNTIKKNMTKKFNLGVSLKTPKEFDEKKTYMQSDEFLKNPHNTRMFCLIDELMEYRDEITKEVAYMNMILNGKVTQAINGFIRIKDDLANNFSKNFNNEPNITSMTQTEYKKIKKVLQMQSNRAK